MALLMLFTAIADPLQLLLLHADAAATPTCCSHLQDRSVLAAPVTCDLKPFWWAQSDAVAVVHARSHIASIHLHECCNFGGKHFTRFD